MEEKQREDGSEYGRDGGKGVSCGGKMARDMGGWREVFHEGEAAIMQLKQHGSLDQW